MMKISKRIYSFLIIGVIGIAASANVLATEVLQEYVVVGHSKKSDPFEGYYVEGQMSGGKKSEGATGGGGSSTNSASTTNNQKQMNSKPRKTKNCGFVMYPNNPINMYDSCQQTTPTSKSGRAYIVISGKVVGSNEKPIITEEAHINVNVTTWVTTGVYCCSTGGGCSGIASVENSKSEDTYWSLDADDCDEADAKVFKF